MKRFIPLFIIALMCASCEPNNPSKDKGDNQPANPYMWSPVGKMYVYDWSGDRNPYGYEYLMHIVYFFSEDSVVSYGTIYQDLSPMPDEPFYNLFAYKMNYPEVTFTHWMDTGINTFSDTLTLHTGVGIHYLKKD